MLFPKLGGEKEWNKQKTVQIMYIRSGGRTVRLAYQPTRSWLVTATVAPVLETKILAILQSIRSMSVLVSSAAKAKVEMVVTDARDEGARIHTPPIVNHSGALDRRFSPTLVTGLPREMKLFEIESFGPGRNCSRGNRRADFIDNKGG